MNGFAGGGDGSHQRIYSFNSIEWILITPQSPESTQELISLSIPLNGFLVLLASLVSVLRSDFTFNSIEWIHSTRQATYVDIPNNCELSIPLNGFMIRDERECFVSKVSFNSIEWILAIGSTRIQEQG